MAGIKAETALLATIPGIGEFGTALILQKLVIQVDFQQQNTYMHMLV